MTTCATSRRFTRGAAMAWMRGTYQGQLSRRVRSQRRGSSVKHIAAKQSGPGRDRPRRRDLVFLPPRSRPRGTEGPRIALRRAPNWLRATSRPHIAVRRSWRFARRNPSCSSSCCRPLVPRRRRLGRRPEAAHRISTRSLRADGAGSRALPLAACLRAHAFGRSIKRWLPQPRKRPASQRTPRDAVGAEEDLPQPKGSCCAPTDRRHEAPMAPRTPSAPGAPGWATAAPEATAYAPLSSGPASHRMDRADDMSEEEFAAVRQWTPDQVGAWLKNALNLGQYAAAFVRHEITGDLLASIDEHDLREIGIEVLGHRKRILQSLTRVKVAFRHHRRGRTIWEAGEARFLTACQKCLWEVVCGCFVLSPRGASEDGSRRRRGSHVDIPWRRVAATPRRRRGNSVETLRSRPARRCLLANTISLPASRCALDALVGSDRAALAVPTSRRTIST